MYFQVFGVHVLVHGRRGKDGNNGDRKDVVLEGDVRTASHPGQGCKHGLVISSRNASLELAPWHITHVE